MKRLPSRWWHLVSVLVFLVGAVGAPITMIFLIMAKLSSGEEFFVPGTRVLKLDKPGKYVVWNVESQFRDGKQYSFPASLPNGTRIKIVDGNTGGEMPTSASMSSTETSGNVKRSSVCSFIIHAPGSYSVNVDGTSEERLLMVRHSMAWSVLRLFLLGGLVSVAGWILAPAISVVVEVRRYRARNEPATPQPPPIPAERV